MGQQFKSQPKKLTGKTFSFWLQFSFSATFKVIYQIFFGYLTNNKPKTKNQLKYEQKNYEPSTPKIFTRPTSHLLASSYIHIILKLKVMYSLHSQSLYDCQHTILVLPLDFGAFLLGNIITFLSSFHFKFYKAFNIFHNFF